LNFIILFLIISYLYLTVRLFLVKQLVVSSWRIHWFYTL